MINDKAKRISKVSRASGVNILKSLTIEIPDELAQIWLDRKAQGEAVEEELKELMALSLVRKGMITASKGAELLSKSYQEFLDLMKKYDIPILDYEAEGVNEDLKTLKRILNSQKRA